MECISRAVQYGLGYILGVCKCLRVFVLKEKLSVTTNVSSVSEDKQG